eukprot:TRINITY_DN26742_c0_g1_i1.p1 TRINITY_DN26742_c0_g1~~TRINITY_DN26742_c0_g1_i1.p1  ORF type:complete len:282 (-),score=57.56 TRINITY_DN26742_c0_g1_i1:8-853(-)
MRFRITGKRSVTDERVAFSARRRRLVGKGPPERPAAAQGALTNAQSGVAAQEGVAKAPAHSDSFVAALEEVLAKLEDPAAGDDICERVSPQKVPAPPRRSSRMKKQAVVAKEVAPLEIPQGASPAPPATMTMPACDAVAQQAPDDEGGQELVYSRKLFDALLSRLPMEDQGSAEHLMQVDDLAREIALELTQQLRDPRMQLRALLFNIRDKQNPDFWREVISGDIHPWTIPKLPTGDMASLAKRTARHEQRNEYLNEHVLKQKMHIDRHKLAAYRAVTAKH